MIDVDRLRGNLAALHQERTYVFHQGRWTMVDPTRVVIVPDDERSDVNAEPR